MLDAQVLMGYILDKPRAWVMAHGEIELDRHQMIDFNQALSRLAQGEPLPYVIGHWEFFGLDFQLTADTLIPRPETELLVERCLDWLHNHPGSRRAIDIGTGSGCIGISLAMHVPDLQALLSDISPAALEIARKNAARYGLLERVSFQQADILEGISGAFDLMCANLPYIPSLILTTLPVAMREPKTALDGGQSGTELISRLLDQARHNLAPGGMMILEIDSIQGPELVPMAEELYPAAQVQVLQDLSGADRCLEVKRSVYIVHLCQREAWLNALSRGVYECESLGREGFIHCSPPELVLQVANRFYRGNREMVILWIDPEKISSEIRWEPADDSLFPHIYGPINLEAVVGEADLELDEGGEYSRLTTPA